MLGRLVTKLLVSTTSSYYSFLFGDENGPFSGANLLFVVGYMVKTPGNFGHFSRLLTAPWVSSCHRHCEAHP